MFGRCPCSNAAYRRVLVQHVADHFEAVLDKYMEYQTEDLGDLFMRSMLHDSGVEVKATSRERKRKRK